MEADKRNLEQWLERALKQYGAAEPRPGLEARVLARLQAESTVAPIYRRCWLPAAAVLAAAVALFVWLGSRSGPRPGQPLATNTAVSKPVAAAIQATPPERAANASAHPRTRLRRVAGQAVAAMPPKLRQFPSPRPLSQQEKRLLAFVRQAPREQVQAAVAQREQTAITALSIKDLDIPPLASMQKLEQAGRN